MRDHYLNILILPNALEFHNAALGARRRVTLPGLTGQVWLPRANNAAIGKPFAELLPPKTRHLDYAIRVHKHVHAGDAEEFLWWGKYFTYNKNDPVGTAKATVGAAVLTFPSVQAGRRYAVEELAKKCVAAFPSWASRLIDWIEVLTQDDLNAAHPLRSPVDPNQWPSQAWIHKAGRRLDYTFVSPGVNLYGSDGRYAMSADVWSKAIRAANRGQEIPETWALLRDSRAAQRRGNRRRAVLDAATAVELTIASVLRARLLQDNPAPFVDKLLKSTWQVARRFEMMTTLGMWLPAQIEVKLTKVRNRVVHSNGVVTDAQASAAVKVTDALLRQYALDLLRVG